MVAALVVLIHVFPGVEPEVYLRQFEKRKTQLRSAQALRQPRLYFRARAIPGIKINIHIVRIKHAYTKMAVRPEYLDCSGLMYPDTNLGENARHGEVFDEQAKTYIFP